MRDLGRFVVVADEEDAVGVSSVRQGPQLLLDHVNVGPGEHAVVGHASSPR